MTHRGLIGCAAPTCKAWLPYNIAIEESTAGPCSRVVHEIAEDLGWEWLTATPDDGTALVGYFCPRHSYEVKASDTYA